MPPWKKKSESSVDDLISPCDILCGSLEKIETAGWIQGSEHNSKGYCMKGACHATLNQASGLTDRERSLMEELVVMHLCAAIEPDAAPSWSVVTGCNDKQGQTKAGVLRVMRRAGACPSP